MVNEILIKPVDLAKIFNVSRMAITKWTKIKGPLEHAVKDGKIDLYSSSVKEWAQAKGIEIPDPGELKKVLKTSNNQGRKMEPKKTDKSASIIPNVEKRGRPKKETSKKSIAKTDQGKSEINFKDYEFDVSEKDDPENIENMTLKEIGKRFATHADFSAHLNQLKTIADIKTKNLSNSEKEGSLISREFVKKFVFSAIEETNSRLLTDAPRAIAARLKDHFDSGGTLEDGEELSREMVSQFLKSVKAKVTRLINNA